MPRRAPTSKKGRRRGGRGSRFAREIIHDVLACVGEFAGTVSLPSIVVLPLSRADPPFGASSTLLRSSLRPFTTVHVPATRVPWCPVGYLQSRRRRRDHHDQLERRHLSHRPRLRHESDSDCMGEFPVLLFYVAGSSFLTEMISPQAFFKVTGELVTWSADRKLGSRIRLHAGAAFNPAVTMALWLVGGLTARRAIFVVCAQLLGGIAAAGAARGLTIGKFGLTNTLAPGVSTGQGLGIELATTAMLSFVVLMLTTEKSKSTFLAPVAIGLSVWLGHVASIGWTGAGMNPARSLGPSVITGSFPSNAWL